MSQYVDVLKVDQCYESIRFSLSLIKENRPLSEKIIDSYINLNISTMLFDLDEKEKAILFDDIKHQITIELSSTDQQSYSISDIQQNHQDWLNIIKTDTSIKWDHTNEYFKYLAREKTPTGAIAKIRKESTDILSLIENPRREGLWDNRGLVVGDVQSGKTSNYIALIAKAIDAGYKNIIVLAGITNDLRKQTQERIDAGLLGYVSSKRMQHAVIQTGFKGTAIQARTDATPNGDFKIGATTGSINFNGADCNLFVIKKNATILTHVHKALSNFCKSHCEGNRISSPLLMIDDEADNASVNGKQQVYDPITRKIVSEQEVDPAKVNALIRAILSCFSRSSYVGYTATPYANIFGVPSIEIDKTTTTKKGDVIFVGEDLFPRNFIYRLESPSNYYGPIKVFGLEDDSSDQLPIVLKIDEKNYFPDDFEIIKNNKIVLKNDPDSLKFAVNCFLISATVKTIRRRIYPQIKTPHNTMLVHVDRLTAKHEDLKDWIDKYVDCIKKYFTVGDPKERQDFLKEIENIWKDEFEKKQAKIKQMTNDPLLVDHNWDEIKQELPNTIKSLIVLVINGLNPDVILDYTNHPEGRNVIAIGGDKLARGLTLEGLSISYFMRSARAFDSLSQMGRWFGYRDGYIDVCRMMSTSQIIKGFEEIAMAEFELKNDFIELHDTPDATPSDFGLKVITNPNSTMLVTAINKARNVKKTLTSFSCRAVSTVYIPKDDQIRINNLHVLDLFLKSLPQSFKKGDSVRQKNKNECEPIQPDGKSKYWENVDSGLILNGLLKDKFYVDKDASSFSLKNLVSYIEKMNSQYNEISYWTVALVSGNEKDQEIIDKYGVYGSRRALEPIDESASYYEINRRRLSTGADEAFDLDKDQYEKALENTNKQRAKHGKKETDTISPSIIRSTRDKKKGLLLIYILKLYTNDNPIPSYYPAFMVSLPQSEHRDTYVKTWENVVATANKQLLLFDN